jgi:hypothetical protein
VSDLLAGTASGAPATGGDIRGAAAGAADAAGATEADDAGCANAALPNTNPKDNPKNKAFQNRIFDPLELAGRTYT